MTEVKRSILDIGARLQEEIQTLRDSSKNNYDILSCIIKNGHQVTKSNQIVQMQIDVQVFILKLQVLIMHLVVLQMHVLCIRLDTGRALHPKGKKQKKGEKSEKDKHNT